MLSRPVSSGIRASAGHSEQHWSSRRFRQTPNNLLGKPAQKTFDVGQIRTTIASIASRRSMHPGVEAAANRFAMAWPHTGPIRIHSEMQLLFQLETQLPVSSEPLLYFGCSKRACWLCRNFLLQYGSRFANVDHYGTRGCHGKVYTMWDVG